MGDSILDSMTKKYRKRPFLEYNLGPTYVLFIYNASDKSKLYIGIKKFWFAYDESRDVLQIGGGNVKYGVDLPHEIVKKIKSKYDMKKLGPTSTTMEIYTKDLDLIFSIFDNFISEIRKYELSLSKKTVTGRKDV